MTLPALSDHACPSLPHAQPVPLPLPTLSDVARRPPGQPGSAAALISGPARRLAQVRLCVHMVPGGCCFTHHEVSMEIGALSLTKVS